MDINRIIEKKKKLQLFRELYNPNLNNEDNRKYMEEHGLTISIASFFRFKQSLTDSDSTLTDSDSDSTLTDSDSYTDSDSDSTLTDSDSDSTLTDSDSYTDSDSETVPPSEDLQQKIDIAISKLERVTDLEDLNIKEQQFKEWLDKHGSTYNITPVITTVKIKLLRQLLQEAERELDDNKQMKVLIEITKLKKTGDIDTNTYTKISNNCSRVRSIIYEKNEQLRGSIDTISGITDSNTDESKDNRENCYEEIDYDAEIIF